MLLTKIIQKLYPKKQIISEIERKFLALENKKLVLNNKMNFGKLNKLNYNLDKLLSKDSRIIDILSRFRLNHETDVELLIQLIEKNYIF